MATMNGGVSSRCCGAIRAIPAAKAECPQRVERRPSAKPVSAKARRLRPFASSCPGPHGFDPKAAVPVCVLNVTGRTWRQGPQIPRSRSQCHNAEANHRQCYRPGRTPISEPTRAASIGKIGEEFASHTTAIHSIGEYVRRDAHTNTVEGYFSMMKRGIYGVYKPRALETVSVRI